MTKTNTIKKVVNGEIADADDVNQIVENAGAEGGSFPYNEDNQQRSTDGSESLGNTSFPWGDLNINALAQINEIDTVSPSVSASVTFNQLRKFITLKDTPASYSGQGSKIATVNTAEDAIIFEAAPGSVEVFAGAGTDNWTAPTGVNFVEVSACGAGGGGGGTAAGTGQGGGGGAGQSLIGLIMKVTPGNTYSFTRGAGGAGGAVGDNDGAAGGNTSIIDDVGNTITLLGGNFGSKGSVSTGGAATAANTDLDGQPNDGIGTPGEGGTPYKWAGGAGGTAIGTSGTDEDGAGGGSSRMGLGGDGGNQAAGVDAGPGGGGGGAGSQSGTGFKGGDGGAGVIVIKYNVNGTPA